MNQRRILYLDPKHSRRKHTMEHLPQEMVNAAEDTEAAQETLSEQPFDAIVAPLEAAAGFTDHARALVLIGFEDAGDGITMHFLNAEGETVYEQGFKNVAEVLTLLADGRLFATIPLPDNESGRMDVVRNLPLNNLEEEPSLQSLTELAAHVFAVPSAYIGVVDADQERFLSCFGIDLTPTKRKDTICAHTIAQDDILVVEDTREDPRFAGKGFAEAGVVWYAGAPIRSPHGNPVGTFCLASEEPRSFTETDRNLLQLFAEETWDVFDLYTKLRDSQFMAGYIQ